MIFWLQFIPITFWSLAIILEHIILTSFYISKAPEKALNIIARLFFVVVLETLTFGIIFLAITLYIITLIYYKKLNHDISSISLSKISNHQVDYVRYIYSELSHLCALLENISSKVQLTILADRFIMFNICLLQILSAIYRQIQNFKPADDKTSVDLLYLLRESPIVMLQIFIPTLLANEVRKNDSIDS